MLLGTSEPRGGTSSRREQQQAASGKESSRSRANGNQKHSSPALKDESAPMMRLQEDKLAAPPSIPSMEMKPHRVPSRAVFDGMRECVGAGDLVDSSTPPMMYHGDRSLFAHSWSWHGDIAKVALGTMVGEYNNEVVILGKHEDAGMVFLGRFTHPFPPTRVLWQPGPENLGTPDLIATAGDYLRLWEVRPHDHPNGRMNVKRKAMLSIQSGKQYCDPVPSMDWSAVATNTIATACMDATVTVWDIGADTPTATVQLVAHEKATLDLSFSSNPNLFASCGLEGSLRVFDLRFLSHSTIVMETPRHTPLVRVEWSQMDSNHVACLDSENNQLRVLDMRNPSVPVCRLRPPTESHFTDFAWSPSEPGVLATSDQAGLMTLWDMNQATQRPGTDRPSKVAPTTTLDSEVFSVPPAAMYCSSSAINSICWHPAHPEFISSASGKRLEVLTV